tara:strand:- start:1635 stop:2285 length:651 start_codon:yes stop_codon:yes gene_type:complete
MGTVRFSDSLKDDILKNANGMFDNKLVEVINSYPKEWGDKIYDCFFPADVHVKLNSLPPYAMALCDSMRFEGFHGGTDEWKLNTPIPLSFATPRKHMNSWNQEVMGAIFKYGALTLDFKDSRWDWIKPEFQSYKEAITKVEEKQKSFSESVRKIITSYNTLGPALKSWRGLWELIPEEAKERHKKIVTRPNKVDATDMGVDFDSMTSVVTLSKLTK